VDHITPVPPAPNQQHQGLTDGLSLWDAETSSPPAGLSLLRIDGNETLIIPFTTSMQRDTLHYLDSAAYRGYTHCPGPGCLLCRIGRQSEIRDLLPVYDPVAQAVAVLAISPNLRPHALRPQLAPLLRQLRQDARIIIALRKLDNIRFAVTTLPLPDDADDGADKIAAFVKQVEANAIDLGSVYPRLGNEELAALPDVASAMRLKGIKSA
jgi:hypothetical protein